MGVDANKHADGQKKAQARTTCLFSKTKCQSAHQRGARQPEGGPGDINLPDFVLSGTSGVTGACVRPIGLLAA